eukprot:TRINITY_DN10708_c0_g1_i1.p1 TRINITY_DN10708_c0_g1~~TRINITY_DN10708_c0_g1_i1.p1  ORF type:complete len:857 (+),score=157.37 TRINITY_DN10708_c0_g1_i1:101-2671(+)
MTTAFLGPWTGVAESSTVREPLQQVRSHQQLSGSQLPPAGSEAAVASSSTWGGQFPWQTVGLSCAALSLAAVERQRRNRMRSDANQSRAGRTVVAMQASVLEQTTLEAGAQLLQDAMRAADRGSPTKFSQQAEAKNRQSYVSQQAAATGDEDPNAVDSDGLPLVYSVDRIASFWDTRPGELAERWSRFLRISTPFITKFFYSLLNNRLWEDEAELAKMAVDNLTDLGPTFVKLGQVLSIRPDVLPPVTMKELSRLQENVRCFTNEEAYEVIQTELGQPVDELFSEITPEPVAAASLAQVYKATLKSTGEEVAVKVQRPGGLGTVSKDLYVLRRLADVTQPLIRRFTADETDYIALTETFAEGLYTELDFRNEALNAIKMQELLDEYLAPEYLERIVIPKPLLDFTTRRVMLSQWVPGVKLSTLPQEEIKEFIKIGQEVFLTQLLEIGFFHGDPHPGNLLKVVSGPDEGKLCLLDFGLVAQVPEDARDIIVTAVVHLGTQNWDAFIDDFIALGFLTPEIDRPFLTNLLTRILGPYLRGGGANSLKGLSFSDLSQDLLKLNLDVAFSIPPYVSLLARSVATLEGIALQGDPQYQIVAQAYPFVVRKLLRNESGLQFSALRELLYDPSTRRLQPRRLSAMLQASLGMVADNEAAGFIDFDAVPKDGAPLADVASFLLSGKAANLRPLLNAELAYGVDLLFRRNGRQLRQSIMDVLSPRVPLLGFRLPAPPTPPLLVPLPPKDDGGAFPSIKLMQPNELVDSVLPALSTREEVDLETLTGAATGALIGDVDLSSQTFASAFSSLLANGSSDDNVALQEFADAVRQTLLSEHARQTLQDEVVLAVASEVLRVWRARIEATA